MKIFLDTSSLFKFYHKEDGTDALESFFSTKEIEEVFLSEISKIEFTSTIWKKVRTKEISIEEAQTTLSLFEEDLNKFVFVSTDNVIIEEARILVSKYGTQGLRTLDSIQLSTCKSLITIVDIFFTADKLLKSLLVLEGMETDS